MADEKNSPQVDTGQNGNEQAAGTADAQQSQFTMIGQYVKDLSFENPRAPESLQKMQGSNPDIKVDVNVSTKQVGEEVFEVSMELSATAKLDKETMFIAELNYGSLFGIRNVTEDQMRPLLLVECPRLMFPFARRILSDATRDGGFPPLILDPIDFLGLYNQQQAGSGGQPTN